MSTQERYTAPSRAGLVPMTFYVEAEQRRDFKIRALREGVSAQSKLEDFVRAETAKDRQRKGKSK